MTETALTNSFQHYEDDGEAQNALIEFDNMVQQLQQNGIEVTVINDSNEPKKPDAIFPNNWFSTHADGTCILYPMLHQNRRIERRADIIQQVCKSPENIIDLSYLEKENLYLEGTGSLVLDHEFKIAYAVISPRTSVEALTIFEAKDWLQSCFLQCLRQGATAHLSYQCGDGFESYKCGHLFRSNSKKDQEILLQSFAQSKKEVIEISLQQLENFAGNMLCLRNTQNINVLVMSLTAFDSLNVAQLNALKKHHRSF
jgi:hypothetical protein